MIKCSMTNLNFDSASQPIYDTSESNGNPSYSNKRESLILSNEASIQIPLNTVEFDRNICNEARDSYGKTESAASTEPNKEEIISVLPDDSSNGENILDITNEGKRKNPLPCPSSIPAYDLSLAKFTFIMFGVAGVLNWSVLLNCILSIFTIIYDFPQGADTVLLGYFILSVIAGVLRVRARNISENIVHSGMIILVFTNLLLPLTIQFISGITGIVILHILGSIIGLAVSFIVANGLAYSCIIPRNLTGFVVAGNGLAGLMAFIIWQILTEVFFNVYSKSELKIAVWILFSFCFLCILIQSVLFDFMKKKEWFKYSLDNFQKTTTRKEVNKIKADSTNNPMPGKSENHSEQHISQCRPLKTLIRISLPNLLLSAGSFFISYSLFPSIGPYDWVGASLKESSILVGIYQTFDFIGRYIPNVNKIFEMPRKFVFILVILRILFYPLFITFALYKHAVTENFIIQMLLIIIFAITNGLVSTQSLSDVPKCFKTIAEKGTMGMVMHLFTQISIANALIFSKILKLTLRIHFH